MRQYAQGTTLLIRRKNPRKTQAVNTVTRAYPIYFVIFQTLSLGFIANAAFLSSTSQRDGRCQGYLRLGRQPLLPRLRRLCRFIRFFLRPHFHLSDNAFANEMIMCVCLWCRFQGLRKW